MSNLLRSLCLAISVSTPSHSSLSVPFRTLPSLRLLRDYAAADRVSEHESEVSPAEIRSAPKSGGESQVLAAVDTRVGSFVVLTAVCVVAGLRSV